MRHLIAADYVIEVAVSSHADGSSTIAWVLQEPDFFNLLYVQRFDAEGSPSTARALVYESRLPARALQVATDSAGNDLVAFNVRIGLMNATDQYVDRRELGARDRSRSAVPARAGHQRVLYLRGDPGLRWLLKKPKQQNHREP